MNKPDEVIKIFFVGECKRRVFSAYFDNWDKSERPMQPTLAYLRTSRVETHEINLLLNYQVVIANSDSYNQIPQDCAMILHFWNIKDMTSFALIQKEYADIKARFPGMKVITIAALQYPSTHERRGDYKSEKKYDKKLRQCRLKEEAFEEFAKKYNIEYYIVSSSCFYPQSHLRDLLKKHYFTDALWNAHFEAKKSKEREFIQQLKPLQQECESGCLSNERFQEILKFCTENLKGLDDYEETRYELSLLRLRVHFYGSLLYPNDYFLNLHWEKNNHDDYLKIFIDEIIALNRQDALKLAAYTFRDKEILFKKLRDLVSDMPATLAKFSQLSAQLNLDKEIEEWVESSVKSTHLEFYGSDHLAHFITLHNYGVRISVDQLAYFKAIINSATLRKNTFNREETLALTALIRDNFSDQEIYELIDDHRLSVLINKNRLTFLPILYTVLQGNRRKGECVTDAMIRYDKCASAGKASIHTSIDVASNEIDEVVQYFIQHPKTCIYKNTALMSSILNTITAHGETHSRTILKTLQHFRLTKEVVNVVKSCLENIIVEIAQDLDVDLSLQAINSYCESQLHIPADLISLRFKACFFAAGLHPQRHLQDLHTVLTPLVVSEQTQEEEALIVVHNTLLASFGALMLQIVRNYRENLALAAYIATTYHLPEESALCKQLDDLAAAFGPYKEIDAIDNIQRALLARGKASESFYPSETCELLSNFAFLKSLNVELSADLLSFFKVLLQTPDITDDLLIDISVFDLIALTRATHTDREVFNLIQIHNAKGLGAYFCAILQEGKREHEGEDDTWTRFAMMLALNIRMANFDGRKDSRLITLFLAEKAMALGNDTRSVDCKPDLARSRPLEYLQTLIMDNPEIYLRVLNRIFQLDTATGEFVSTEYLKVIGNHPSVAIPNGMALAMQIQLDTCTGLTLGAAIGEMTSPEIFNLARSWPASRQIPIFQILSCKLSDDHQIALASALHATKKFSQALVDITNEIKIAESSDSQREFICRSLGIEGVENYDAEYFVLLNSLVPIAPQPLGALFFQLFDHLIKRNYESQALFSLTNNLLKLYSELNNYAADITELLQRGANPFGVHSHFVSLVLGNPAMMQLAAFILTYYKNKKCKLDLSADIRHASLLIELGRNPEVNLELFQLMLDHGFQYNCSDFDADDFQNITVLKLISREERRRRETLEQVLTPPVSITVNYFMNQRTVTKQTDSKSQLLSSEREMETLTHPL